MWILADHIEEIGFYCVSGQMFKLLTEGKEFQHDSVAFLLEKGQSR